MQMCRKYEISVKIVVNSRIFSQSSEILADILPSEHCPVLSKCIIELCSHEKFAIFICMYLQKIVLVRRQTL